MRREDVKVPQRYRNASGDFAYRSGYIDGMKDAAIEGAKMAVIGQFASDLVNGLAPPEILEIAKKGARRISRPLRRAKAVKDYFDRVAGIFGTEKEDDR